MNHVLLLIAIILAFVAYVLTRRLLAAPTTPGWTALTNNNDYGTLVDRYTGNFAFPVGPNSVHAVTRDVDTLHGYSGIRMRYRLDAPPETKFHRMLLVNGLETVQAESVASAPIVYFQRKGDDWSAQGPKEAYRWWATSQPQSDLATGEFTIEVDFEDKWTAVLISDSITNTEAFVDALRNAARVGFTFPGATGLAHGACADKPGALFTLLEFSLIPTGA